MSRGSRSTRFLFLPLFRGTRRISVDYRPEQSGAGAREDGEGELKAERQEETMKRGGKSKGRGRSTGSEKKEEAADRRKRGCSTGSATREGARKDEEKGEENNSRPTGKTKLGGGERGGKFSIKLHGNGRWLTRGVV